MRGYLIEIAYDPEDVGALNANDFIGTRDGQTFSEWYEDGDEQECTRVFQDKFTKYGAVFGREEGVRYVSFSAEAKQAVFADRYERFMKKVGGMTLETFASEQIDEYERLIEDIYDDAVYLTNEKYAVSMDKFIRMVEPGERYYIGNILLMR